MTYASYARMIERCLRECEVYAGWDGPLGRLNRGHLVALAEYLYARMHRAGNCCG